MKPLKITGGLRGWERLRPSVQDNYLAALEVLNDSRREGKTIRQAAADDGRISYSTTMRYIGSATRRDAFGRVVPKAADRLFRPMDLLRADGERVMRATYGSGVASEVGAHDADIGMYLDTGDPAYLARHRGSRAGGVELASDPDVVEQAAREGLLDDLEPYPRGTR